MLVQEGLKHQIKEKGDFHVLTIGIEQKVRCLHGCREIEG